MTHPPPRPDQRVDLHLHSTASDGTYTPAQLAELWVMPEPDRDVQQPPGLVVELDALPQAECGRVAPQVHHLW